MKPRIRAKIAAVVAVPLVALVAVSAVQATRAMGEADDIERDVDAALVLVGPDSVVAALQHERAWTSLDLLGLVDQVDLGTTTYEATRRATDTAVAALQGALGDLEPGVRGALGPALEALERLDEPRRVFETHVGPRALDNVELADEVWVGYTDVVSALLQATPAAAAQVDRAEVRTGAEIIEAASRRSESVAAAARAVVLDLAGEPGTGERRTRLIRLVERIETAERRIEQLATGPYAAVVAEAPDTQRTRELLGDHLAGEDVAVADLVAEVGTRSASAAVVPQAAAVLTGDAEARADQARNEALVLVLVAVGALVVAIAIAIVATRSITPPVGERRDEADASADRPLPDAPGTDAEVPAVADIEVAAPAALEVAGGTFLDLGHRNQALLDRQLELIEALERSETAPDQLDALFRLDHLATRMRRNTESQLVLAGGRSPRRWDAPVDVDAVVRAGLGEVEEHQRVRIRHLEPAAIAGDAVADLSHVVAELVENALASAPTAAVIVDGRGTPDGYVVTVADQGAGMPDPELAAANRRLGGEGEVPATSGALGHHVAGHLARRHGAAVRLDHGPAGGIVATVAIPPAVVEGRAAAAPDEVAIAPPIGDGIEDEVEDGVEVEGSDGPRDEEVDVVAAPGPEDAAFAAWFAQGAADGLEPSTPESLAEALGDGRLDELAALAEMEEER